MNFLNKKKVQKAFMLAVVLVLILTTSALPVFAANDAVAAVTNLSNFMFTILKAVGSLIIAYGLLQFGLSFQAHDASQRSQGILVAVGGIIIASAESIVNTIAG